ncbi:hypothetical protein CBR_g39321 [Chara braunii]|uniref:Transcription factor TFIIIC triple barrel domain-containing protein n=1 Tax=Chara braunii TaxID=69332 RepID=A0A388K170_CHABU|nr:hypothetical protein CBR_g39321 [Chara braunii]|eukprot:GBG63777.1 hypothetical protein CBR_g39321 [Chara braunii]
MEGQDADRQQQQQQQEEAEEEEEEEEEVEYVVLDLGTELHGAGLPQLGMIKLYGLATDTPHLVFPESGIELTGTYEETVGSQLFFEPCAGSGEGDRNWTGAGQKGTAALSSDSDERRSGDTNRVPSRAEEKRTGATYGTAGMEAKLPPPVRLFGFTDKKIKFVRCPPVEPGLPFFCSSLSVPAVPSTAVMAVDCPSQNVV